MNDLKDYVEEKIITRTFNISGMPLKVYNELDLYCKEQYGDSRWTMVYDLMKYQTEDYKYQLLYDTLMSLKMEVDGLKVGNATAPPTSNVKPFKSFGGEQK